MARTNRERSGHCEVRWATTGVEQPGLGTTVLGFVVVSGVRNASKITKRWTLRGLGVGTGSPPLGRPPKAQGVVRELADLRPKVRQVQLHSWGCILQWSGAMGGGSQVRHPLHKHPVGGSSQAGHLLRNPALDDSIGGS